MALNITRIGTSAVVGAASGAIDPSIDSTRVIELGGQVISWSAILEAVALVGGGALQLMSPHLAPNVADGMVDSGAALLAARGTRMALKPEAAGARYPARMPALASGVTAPMYGRAQIGNMAPGGRRVKLT